MGCDIHAYKEKFIDGRWLTADAWEAYDYGDDDKGKSVPYEKRPYTGRNYVLFGILSKGVRSEHAISFPERGMPFDASSEVAADSDRWDSDGHSHSYLYLHEIRQLRLACDSMTVEIEGMKDPEKLAALMKSIASGDPDWNLLFPYCQWASGGSYQEFKLDVPMTFYVGSDLDRIIAAFDGVDGENHRLVFWFDN
jgi:hypothetical protein